MSFLNMILLGGMTAIAIPFAIHLLNRSHYRPVPWAAMTLLESALSQQTQRFDWRALLLLLTRCAIPVLLALALARPVLIHFRMGTGNEQVRITTLVDTSVSMAEAADDHPLIDLAKDELRGLADSLAAFEVSFWDAGGRATPAGRDLSDSPSTVADDDPRHQIEALRATAGYTRWPDAIARAMESATGKSKLFHHIVIVSEFRQSDWLSIDKEALASIRKNVGESEIPVTLSLLPIKHRQQEMQATSTNLAIRFDNPVGNTLVNTPRQVEVVVERFGDGDEMDATVILSIDGQDIAQQTLVGEPTPPNRKELEASNLYRVKFPCEFSEPGWYTLNARLSAPSGLAHDDRADFVIHAHEPDRALIVSSDTLAEQHSNFLALALAPFREQDGAFENNPFRVDHFSSKSSQPLPDLEEVDLVVLDGAERQPSESTQRLVEFIDGGGGLLIFPGAQPDDSELFPDLVDEDGTSLLPGVWSRLIKSDPVGLASLQPTSSPFSAIIDGQAGDTSGWRFHQRYVFEPSSLPSDTRVLLRLADSSPLLISRDFGRGRIVMAATTSGDQWSNWPGRAAYVGLMQQLAHHAMGDRLIANVACGDRLKIQLPQDITSAITIIDQADQSEQIVAPNETGDRAPFVEIDAPGVYRVKASNQNGTDAEEVTLPPLFAVQPSRLESDPKLLDHMQIDDLATQLGAMVVYDASALATQVRETTRGKEIWRWIVLTVLILLIAESVLARHISVRGVSHV